jgi:linoleoyl-CoA desaturase
LFAQASLMEIQVKPRYSKDGSEAIFNDLRKEVYKYINQAQPHYSFTIRFKAIFFPLLYVSVYTCALIFGNNQVYFYSCYFLLGIILVTVFLNVIHDAVHSTIFRSKKLNDAYIYIFDLMGANSFIWKLRHVRFHHNYPNVNGWDTDIEQSDLFRVFPDGKHKPIHKFQHIYLPLLYPFYLANWLFVRDFRDFFNKKRTARKLMTIPVIEYVKLFFFKILFLFLMALLPKMVLDINWATMVAAFLVMLFTASCFSLLVLLSPHANVHSEFPTVKDDTLPDSWMMHMMKTTNDITNDNWFIRFFMGCFNYHIAHHLFPNVNHVYYPGITRMVKEYSMKHHLPYRQFSLWTSLRNHYLLLKQNRQPENIFEETM